MVGIKHKYLVSGSCKYCGSVPFYLVSSHQWSVSGGHKTSLLYLVVVSIVVLSHFILCPVTSGP